MDGQAAVVTEAEDDRRPGRVSLSRGWLRSNVWRAPSTIKQYDSTLTAWCYMLTTRGEQQTRYPPAAQVMLSSGRRDKHSIRRHQ